MLTNYNMHITLQLLIVIATVLFAACLFRKSRGTAQTAAQKAQADQYRMYAYIAFGIAIAAGIYFMNKGQLGFQQKANMCGGAHHNAQMHRGRMHHGIARNVANMCGREY